MHVLLGPLSAIEPHGGASAVGKIAKYKWTGFSALALILAIASPATLEALEEKSDLPRAAVENKTRGKSSQHRKLGDTHDIKICVINNSGYAFHFDVDYHERDGDCEKKKSPSKEFKDTTLGNKWCHKVQIDDTCNSTPDLQPSVTVYVWDPAKNNNVSAGTIDIPFWPFLYFTLSKCGNNFCAVPSDSL